MSGRRHAPAPVAAPVGGATPLIAPPEEVVLASTDPTEAPPPPMPPEAEQEDHRVVGDLPPEVEQEEDLSPEEQVMFASLLTCGRRSKTITLFDHTVVVQTLNGDDDLRISLYVKDYQASIGEQRAYQIGVAAAGIRTVNGVPMIPTLYENADPDDLFDQKVKKVAQMYPHVIKKIYDTVLDAEKEFITLANRLGKFDG